MRLKEFVDKDGNKINLPRSTGNASGNNKTSSGDYKKRFEKLLNYHIAHKDKSVDKVFPPNIMPYGFTYVEHHGDGINGYTKKVTAAITYDTEEWVFNVYMDGREVARETGKTWEKFVWNIANYLALPQVSSDPEYQELLEFVDASGKKVNLPKTSTKNTVTTKGSYWKRFEKLLEYAIAHKASNVGFISLKDITDTYLKFIEYYSRGNVDHTVYRITIDPATEEWNIKVDCSNGTKDNDSGTGWANLLKQLRYYITIPVVGTPEYKDLMFEDSKSTFAEDLLHEFVDASGNKITLPRSTNTSSTATSSQPASKTNKEKFEELVIYMKYYQVPYTTKMEVARLNDLGLKYIISRKPVGVKEYTITLDVHYSRFIDSWQFTVYKNDDYLDDASGKGWAELLKALRDSEFGTYAIIPKPGSMEYDYLCESATSSLADDFKLYENLWD
jgi:hypothetical protein